MFLHSGAGMHRHEYSNPAIDNRRNSVPRRIPLTRAAFSTPLAPQVTTSENPTPIIKRAARPVSDLIPRTSEPIVRFQDPDPDTMSEDGRSVANSEASETTAGGGRRRRRSARSSTAYAIAHPAPTLTQKQKLLQIRPKLLLQLQLISVDSRPKPALDVLPSTVVVPRLAKRFPRIFKGKAELGCHDVMVVKSEEYDAVDDVQNEGSDSDDDGLANRDLIAVVCQARKDSGGSLGKAEIVLSDGSVWMASPLPNGLYEFITIDERGNKTTARWVRRSTKKPRNTDIADAGASNSELKFTFSILDPSSRRHPILASLTQNKLDIPDYYTSVSSSAGKHPPTSPRAFPGEPEHPFMDGELSSERRTHAVDERMKALIQITSVWVALREGWSPYFKYNDASTATMIQTTPSGRVRSMSLTPDASRPSPVAPCSSTPDSSHSAFGRIRRQSCKLNHANGEIPQQEQTNGPRRAVSAGTAFMQRAAARRAPPSTVASDSDGESHMGAPLRAATENLNDSLSNRFSTPAGSLVLPGSSSTTPDTPTKPGRRTQSAYIPTSALQNGYSFEHNTPVTSGQIKPPSLEKPHKIGRWKAFTNFFRRTNSNSRGD